MNTDDQLTQLGVPTVTLPGLGHNAHVQSPHLSSHSSQLPSMTWTRQATSSRYHDGRMARQAIPDQVQTRLGLAY
jgi:hypothetical protein